MAVPGRPRVILHVDMDAFFASVELLRHPELRGRPVVVGGDGARGVVAAASYEARAYGVFSAMSSVKARRQCPDAVFLHGDHAHYEQVSKRIMDVLRDVTPLVEPLSLDEAFCDVSGISAARDDAAAFGHGLRRAIFAETSLECAVGIGPSKSIAKLASKAAKPPIGRPGAPRVAGPGVVVVEPATRQSFLDPLPVRALWGVGPTIHRQLASLGISTVGDLAALSPALLEHRFGSKLGNHLWEMATGIDDRPVVAERVAKSIGHEETYAKDLASADDVMVELSRLADATASRLVEKSLVCRSVHVKVRYGDFSTISRSTTLDRPTNSSRTIGDSARRLFASTARNDGIRLLGVSVTQLDSDTAHRQLSFDDITDEQVTTAEQAVDEIRQRFGPGAIASAALVRKGRLDVRRRGDQQWGRAAEAVDEDHGR